MKQSNKQIAKIISESEQNNLFSKECLESMVRDSQVNHFLTNLHDSFLSITKRVELMSEKSKLEFVQDYYLSHKFQKFFQNLDSVVQNLNSP